MESQAMEMLIAAFVFGAASMWLFSRLWNAGRRGQSETNSVELPPHNPEDDVREPREETWRYQGAPRPRKPFPKITIGKKRRFVVLDCETTGLSAAQGHRIVSLAGIELIGGRPTGNAIAFSFNPGRPSDPRARHVHGLSDEFLSQQQPFEVHLPRIREFVGGSTIIGHNVSFDLSFLKAEMARTGIADFRAGSICTMTRFSEQFPGQRKSLDACCALFGIDASARQVHHGALIDANLTTALFQILMFGEQRPAQYEMLGVPRELVPVEGQAKFPLLQGLCL